MKKKTGKTKVKKITFDENERAWLIAKTKRYHEFDLAIAWVTPILREIYTTGRVTNAMVRQGKPFSEYSKHARDISNLLNLPF